MEDFANELSLNQTKLLCQSTGESGDENGIFPKSLEVGKVFNDA